MFTAVSAIIYYFASLKFYYSIKVDANGLLTTKEPRKESYGLSGFVSSSANSSTVGLYGRSQTQENLNSPAAATATNKHHQHHHRYGSSNLSSPKLNHNNNHNHNDNHKQKHSQNWNHDTTEERNAITHIVPQSPPITIEVGDDSIFDQNIIGANTNTHTNTNTNSSSSKNTNKSKNNKNENKHNSTDRIGPAAVLMPNVTFSNDTHMVGHLNAMSNVDSSSATHMSHNNNNNNHHNSHLHHHQPHQPHSNVNHRARDNINEPPPKAMRHPSNDTENTENSGHSPIGHYTHTHTHTHSDNNSQQKIEMGVLSPASDRERDFNQNVRDRRDTHDTQDTHDGNHSDYHAVEHTHDSSQSTKIEIVTAPPNGGVIVSDSSVVVSIAASTPLPQLRVSGGGSAPVPGSAAREAARANATTTTTTVVGKRPRLSTGGSRAGVAFDYLRSVAVGNDYGCGNTMVNYFFYHLIAVIWIDDLNKRTVYPFYHVLHHFIENVICYGLILIFALVKFGCVGILCAEWSIRRIENPYVRYYIILGGANVFISPILFLFIKNKSLIMDNPNYGLEQRMQALESRVP